MLAAPRRLERSTGRRAPAVAGRAPSRVAAAIAAPAPDLAGRIDLHWSVASAGGGGTTLHEFFPDAGAHLVVRLSPEDCRMVLLGPATERTTVERAAGAEYLGVRFRAGQAPRLADVRSSEVTDGLAELEELGGVPVTAIAERLRLLPDRPARQRHLEALLRREPRPLVEDARCRQATWLLEARQGLARVDGLAAELGLSVRSLERRFLEAFGMTPKRMARLVRLRYVLGDLHGGTFRNLAELAHDRGYSDQAHFIHDFKRLTGRLPGEEDAAGSRQVTRPDTRVVHRVRR